MFAAADGHCDFLYGMVNHAVSFENNKGGNCVSLPALQKGNVKAQFFAAWTDMSSRIPPLQQCLAMIDAYYRILEAHPEELCDIGSRRPDETRLISVLTIEGGEAIEGSLAVLRMLKKLGVRAMTLTWNQNNELAGAAMGRGNKGLTALGFEVLEEMNSIGVALDVSHLSDRGICDALDASSKPIFASHSNARAVYDSKRSLPDELIRAIADQGGTVGINFYGKQLTGEKQSTAEHVADHILHVLKVGGSDCCAIGSDYDGMPSCPVGLEDSSCFQTLPDVLHRRGLHDDLIEKILFSNLYNYICQFV